MGSVSQQHGIRSAYQSGGRALRKRRSRATQQNFFKNSEYTKTFGGTLLAGRRKVARPLSTKMPIHLILRSTHPLARKVFSYQSQKNRKILNKLAKKFHIQILESVFNHTHLHLVIRIPHRKNYVGFVRQLSARLSQLVNLKKGEFFTLRPFTRVLNWGREFKILMNYMKKNYVEAIGVIEVTKDELYIAAREGTEALRLQVQ